MVYQIKYNKFSKGFSLLELIIVLAIFAILFFVSDSVYNNFKSQSNLEVATSGVVEALRLAQSSAQSGKGDSKWGVEFFSNQVVIFKGNTYVTRDSSFDQPLSFPGGISASGLSEIVFEKVSGTTSTTGVSIITNGADTRNININAKGTITY